MQRRGFAGYLANRLIDSPLVPVILVAALLMGAYGLTMTPREDRPEIEVPTALIAITFPGAGVERVDELVARPAGAWASQLERVVEVQTVAAADAALVEIEFATGVSDVQAYAELKDLMESNRGRLPPGAEVESIRTVGDEVFTGLMITLSSSRLGEYELHRLGSELAARLEVVKGVRAITLHGGRPREIGVKPRPQELTAHGLDIVQIHEAISAASLRLPAESLRAGRSEQIRVGAWPASVEEIKQIPVGSGPAGVVRLSEVAEVVDGPAPGNNRTVHWRRGQATEVAAVSLAVTSIPHENISAVTRETLQRLESLKLELIPEDVAVDITYDAGRAATETVQSVLENFFMATVIVVVMILIGLGWRAAVSVSFLIPAILAIVPFAYLWIGFSLNPVSIAAMILAIGLVADDTVIILENIGRHFREAGERTREIVVKAVDEVGNPTILAVFLIVATLLPTAFISGEMGQYTRAIPVGASLAILFSLTIALTVTPFVAYRMLRSPSNPRRREQEDKGDDKGEAGKGSPSGRLATIYRLILNPFFRYTWLRWGLYLGMTFLLIGCIAMIVFRAVQLTLVPFLDREVFVVEIELPPGTQMERTLEAAATIGRRLRSEPEVQAYTVFVGSDGPMLLPAPGPADITVNEASRASLYVQLTPEDKRTRLSYELSQELLHRLPGLLAPFEGQAWIRQIPSGPSSENAIQAEIFGPHIQEREQLAETIGTLLNDHHAAVGMERFPKRRGTDLNLTVDQIRAGAQGVTAARAAIALQMALGGQTATDLDLPGERQPIPVVVRLAEDDRFRSEDLASLYIRSGKGHPVALRDVLAVQEVQSTPHRHRKNQLPVSYVAAAIDRDRSQPVSVQRDVLEALSKKDVTIPEIHWLRPPSNDSETALFWGGEWEITQQVYRDLAWAGLAVFLVIYTLLSAWFNSYLIPLVIMAPIPLVFIGVIPAHWLMGLDIAGLGVLGVIALAGIVVRNAVLLVDFTEKGLHGGMEIRDALISAGVLRTRPILLTAGTVAFGSGALIFEPALQPLGLTLISGVAVGTLLTLLLIPMLYFSTFGPRS